MTEGARFLASRPTDLRGSPPRWHRLYFIVRALPAVLRRLADDLHVPPDGRVLDFGCADVPYRDFFEPSVDFVPADLPGNPHARVELRADGTVPLPDAAFHAVLSTQVLEHVADPALYLREAFRLLRPGGRLLLSTHGLMVWHPDPVDHWRWTCSGLRQAVESAGFRIVAFEGVMGLAATSVQLFQDAFYWRAPRWLRHPLALVLQGLATLLDRWEPRASRDMNAMVFALVAEKPPVRA